MYLEQDCKCLEISTTPSIPTTTTTLKTTTKTTTISASSCGSPQWANDKWCDDENNNAGCNFDGGACCNNDHIGWNTYCQVT